MVVYEPADRGGWGPGKRVSSPREETRGRGGGGTASLLGSRSPRSTTFPEGFFDAPLCEGVIVCLSLPSKRESFVPSRSSTRNLKLLSARPINRRYRETIYPSPSGSTKFEEIYRTDWRERRPAEATCKGILDNSARFTVRGR